MSDEEKTPNDLLMEYVDIYLAPRNRNYKGDELELKFGTKHYNQITKIDSILRRTYCFTLSVHLLVPE